MQDTKLLYIQPLYIIYASATPYKVSAAASFIVSAASSAAISIVASLAASTTGIGALAATINYIADIGAAI